MKKKKEEEKCAHCCCFCLVQVRGFASRVRSPKGRLSLSLCFDIGLISANRTNRKRDFDFKFKFSWFNLTKFNLVLVCV